MADKGPFLTSCIIFYLSVGAAIFQILEEPNWMAARDKYILQKEDILKNYPCLTKEALEEILQVVSEAAGQGVTITGEVHRNTWDWTNSIIFASTIVTTIGFGNVAPKTKGGRVFCILYGLCGIPLCLVWISQLGSFFGNRAKRLSGVLIRKGISVKKVKLICTVLFLLWGLFIHLVIPPFVFMSVEGWSYLEGIYFSFITLTTVGFGDYVAGVNPNIEYPKLYRVFAELWIYMGLAWLSLFFSWNVNMVVEAHKVLKKRRHKHRHPSDEEAQSAEDKLKPEIKQTTIDILNFPKGDDYSTIIKEIGTSARKTEATDNINRSKSCSDILGTDIQTLDHSPQHRKVCISELFLNVPKATMGNGDKKRESPRVHGSNRDPEPAEYIRMESRENKDSGASDSETAGIFFTVPTRDAAQHPASRETRFTISKVVEEDLLLADEKIINQEEKG
ncbi:uncharacterized protein V6R79_024364 [Siganus canaliculatus]